MATTSRTRPGRALVAASVVVAGFVLLFAGCQRYAAREMDGAQLACNLVPVCEPVEVVAERPEGLVGEVVATAPAPDWPLYVAGDVSSTTPSVH